ncbi:MAG: hypothetical protein NTW21_28340 [Verrucomicrobia bacterium]|nr:hypothetical protein [Verrucomicrobiota bacterium]
MKGSPSILTLLISLGLLFVAGCRKSETPSDFKKGQQPQAEGIGTHEDVYADARRIFAEIGDIEISLQESANELLSKEGEFDIFSYKNLYDEKTCELRVSYNRLSSLVGLTKADYDAIIRDLDPRFGPRFEKLQQAERDLKNGRAKDINYAMAEYNYKNFSTTEGIAIKKKVFKGL